MKSDRVAREPAGSRIDDDPGYENRTVDNYCTNCGDPFDEDAQNSYRKPQGSWRPCPNPSPGRPLVDCGVGGHMYTETRTVASMSDPLYVLEDEHGDLFLADAAACLESTSRVELRDHALWDAYATACRAMHKARQAVQDALLSPWQDVTVETLTMKHIAIVRQWASANGKRGLHADATRCESANPPAGAMRRICKHLNLCRGAM